MQMSDDVISGLGPLGGGAFANAMGLGELDGDEGADPGEKYDIAMRHWGEANLPTLAGWLDPSVRDLAPEDFVKKSGIFAVPKLYSDLLMMAGEGHLMHVEYETKPSDTLIRRMYNYRGRIMELFPDVKLTQYVIVLGTGRVEGHDDLLANGFTLDVRVIYVRDRDPAEFLSDPVLAPLAVLAQGSRAVRAKSYTAALCLIRDSGHPETGRLLEVAGVLAAIRLDSSTIWRIQENEMSADPYVEAVENSYLGHRLLNKGREEGREAGRAEGGLEARARLLLALLRTRFGDHSEAVMISERLATWPDAAAVEAITTATDPRTLLTLDPPI